MNVLRFEQKQVGWLLLLLVRKCVFIQNIYFIYIFPVSYYTSVSNRLSLLSAYSSVSSVATRVLYRYCISVFVSIFMPRIKSQLTESCDQLCDHIFIQKRKVVTRSTHTEKRTHCIIYHRTVPSAVNCRVPHC